MSMEYESWELRELYENARDKREQIRILSQLCLVSEKHIAYILKDMGCDTRSFDEEQARKEGKTPMPPGVTKIGRRYRANATYKQRSIHLGSYSTPDKAARIAHAARSAIRAGSFELWFDEWREKHHAERLEATKGKNKQTGLPTGITRRRGMFCVRVYIKEKAHYLGDYKTLQEAKEIMNQARQAIKEGSFSEWKAKRNIKETEVLDL